MKLSIISTLYLSEEHLVEFCRRMALSAQKLTHDYEIILVDDGSPDASLKCALECQRNNPHIKVIELSRNFGHHHAMMAGLRKAQGEYQFLIDCDLEEQPEWLNVFYDEMKIADADVVYGIEDNRKGSVFKRFTGWFFYWAFNLLSETKIPTNLLTIRLMRRPYVEALMQFHEREICIAGLWALAGFNQVGLKVGKSRRPHSSYTWRKSLKYFVNRITSFSNKPLFMIFYSGLTVTCIATLIILGIFLRNKAVDGSREFYLMIMSLWFLGGIILSAIGLVGVYLSRVFMEVKQRPNTTIRRIFENYSPSTFRELNA